MAIFFLVQRLITEPTTCFIKQQSSFSLFAHVQCFIWYRNAKTIQAWGCTWNCWWWLWTLVGRRRRWRCQWRPSTRNHVIVTKTSRYISWICTLHAYLGISAFVYMVLLYFVLLWLYNCSYRTDMTPGGRFKNMYTYELLNLRALKISMLYNNCIFECMGKIICMEFQRVPLNFQTKYLTHPFKDMHFIHRVKFDGS